MAHIEFLGPPGAGKSTVFSQLITQQPYYGGVKDDAIEKMFYLKASDEYKKIYRFFPVILKKFFNEKLLAHWIGNQAFESFIKENPHFISMVSQVMKTATYQPERLFTLLKRSAEEYQIGSMTVKSSDILCLDEGFVHRAAAILWRCEETQFSMKAYFDAVPIPDLVIYVDAPIDVCLKRQFDRDRVVADIGWQQKEPYQVQKELHRVCEQVKTHMEDYCEVTTIKNTGCIQQTKAELLEKIN